MSADIRLAFAHPSERSEATSDAKLRDRISLRDHVREVEIGAFQAERGVKQRIRFNIVVEVSIPSKLNDDVDKILSYDMITDAIDRELDTERLNLLETLAERIADDILTDARAGRVFVRIEKLDRGPGALGVEIVRDQGDARPAEVFETKQPTVVYLDNKTVSNPELSQILDRLEACFQPLILCVAGADTPAPQAEQPAAQRRIDLLAIEQNAWVLAGQDKRCVVVSTRTELDWAMKNKAISVWAPSKIVLDATHRPDLNAIEPDQLIDWFGAEFDASQVISIGTSGPGELISVADALRLEPS